MSRIEEVANRTVLEIAFAYRNGEADPVALTDCLLDRIAGSRHSNAFISVTAERARDEAAAAAARLRAGRPRSALDGVPVAWKDLVDVAGLPTTAGSDLLRHSPPKEADSRAVANLAAAGMVCLGKLNMTEFAYSGLGLNPHFGTPANPNDPATDRAPGGSSSGAGVAVAAGLAPCAIGSDTGGSVRIPAAFNGVVGYKTSEGRIDKTGIVPLSRTYDTVGPLARSVADCVMIDAALRGAVTAEVVRADIRSLAPVAPTNVVLDDAEPAVLENFEASLARLERAGARVERRRVAALEEVAELTARHGTLTAAEAYHAMRDLIESEAVERIDRRVVRRILMGRSMSAHDLLAIQTGRAEAMLRLAAEVGDALLAMPTTPLVAPEIAPLEADDDLFHRVNLRTLRNTSLGNTLALCGLAIPDGRDARGMPTSFLLSGRGGGDDRLLGWGLEVERVLREEAEPARLAG